MLLSELAKLLGLRFEGQDVEVSSVAGLENAGRGQLSFLANPRYTRKVYTTQASAVIVPADFPDPQIPHLKSKNPYLSFAQAMELLHPSPARNIGIHPTAIIAPSARVGIDVYIGPHAVVGARCVMGDRVTIYANCTIYEDVEIGDDCVLHSGSSIRERSRLGKRVIVQNGACVGSDGFGYARRDDESWKKLRQLGHVILEDDVEIGANATIDRATVGQTVIRRGTKIDNLVQVGHSSTVGEDSLLCAQVGLAGSSHVGQHVILAGQVGVAGHLTIADGVVATAQTGIPSSVPAGQVVSGYPARENREWLKQVAELNRLAGLRSLVRDLVDRIAKLEGRIFKESP